MQNILGWMVLGVVTKDKMIVPLQVPVLAFSANAAMSLAAAQHPDFQPVGALGEDELLNQLELIRNHRRELTLKNSVSKVIANRSDN